VKKYEVYWLYIEYFFAEDNKEDEVSWWTLTKKLLASFLDRQLMSAFTTTGANDFAARGCLLTHEKTVGSCSLALTWLVGSFTHME
jgi:hypothetical protein